MLFTDRITFDRPRKTADGYLVTRARAARSGVYEYVGREIDPDGSTFAADQLVRVYRPEAEVFSKDSVASFLMKPITNDHPSEPVTAANWRDYAKGVVGKAMRDGDFLAFDLVLMDKSAIADVESGKRELSNGYKSQIDFTAGETADGQPYDAIQSNIRGNHVALVDKGRAGPLCRISDAAVCATLPAAELIEILTDGQTYSGQNPDGTNNALNAARQSNSQSGSAARQDGEVKMPHTLIIDGLQVTEVSDQAKAAIEKLQGQVRTADEAKTAAETKVGELTATVSTKDGEIAALTKKLEDAQLTPAQLEKLVADRAAIIGQAKAIDATVVTDGKTDAEIRKAVVVAKLGDAAANMDDAAVGGAFAVLAKDAKPVETTDALRATIAGGTVNANDAQAAYDAAVANRRKHLNTAWQGKPAANAA